MEFDMKYIIAILLILAAVFLFYTGKIDLATFLSLITAALAIIGYVMKDVELRRLKATIT